MTVYFKDHDITLHQGDVRDVLADLPPASVNCIVTSPPYYGLRDYGVDGQIGLEASPAEYVEQMRAVFAEARRVLAADGVLWLNLGDSYSGSGAPGGVSQTLEGGTSHRVSQIVKPKPGKPKNLLGVPWRVAFALQDDGWTLRNAVIWNKPNAMPESVTDRLSTRYEHVFLFSKSRRYWFDLDPIREAYGESAGGRTWDQRKAEGEPMKYGLAGQSAVGKGGFANGPGRNPGDVWTVPPQPFVGAHFATMPRELVRRCILSGCRDGGTVLDPFTGSGTTGMVARQLGRKFVGIELNPEYCEISVKRFGEPVFDFSGASVGCVTEGNKQ